MVKFTYQEDPVEEAEPLGLPYEFWMEIPTWTLYVDGSSNKQGSEAGIILTTLKGFQFKYAFRFNFQASNNEAEYKVLLVRL